MKTISKTILLILILGCSTPKQKDTNLEQIDFSWNFNEPTKHNYKISIRATGKNDFRGDGPENVQLFGNGKLIINVKGNELADMSLIDLKMSNVSYEGEIPVDTFTNTSSPVIVQDIKAGDRFSNTPSAIPFDLVFPTISSTLELGNSMKIDSKIAFTANGSRLWSKGLNEIKFEEIITFQGEECALLNGKFEIAKVDIPDEIEGDYVVSTNGTASYVFSLNRRFYVKSELEFFTKFDFSKNEDSEYDESMKMESNNKLLIEINQDGE